MDPTIPLRGKDSVISEKRESPLHYFKKPILNKSEHIKFKRDWVGQVYLASNNSKSRGVAGLISKNLPVQVDFCDVDPEGCYIFLHGYLYGEKHIH